MEGYSSSATRLKALEVLHVLQSSPEKLMNTHLSHLVRPDF